MLIGSWVSGLIVDAYAYTENDATLHDWTGIWLLPALMAAVVMVLFAVYFREPVGKSDAV